MSAQHTPGPWHVGNGDVFADGTAASDFDDRVICAIGKSGFRSHEYAPVQAHKPEGQANARLIAAAPDLLNALQGVMDILGRPQINASGMGAEWDYVGPRVAAARAAIAKAVQP